MGLSLNDAINDSLQSKKKTGLTLDDAINDSIQSQKVLGTTREVIPVEVPKKSTSNFFDQAGKEFHDVLEGFKESASGRNLQADQTQGSGFGKQAGEFLGPIGGAFGSTAVGAGIGTAIEPGLGTLGGAVLGGGYGLWRGYQDYINRKKQEGIKDPNQGSAWAHGALEGTLNTIVPGVGGSILKRLGTNAFLGAAQGGIGSTIDQQTDTGKIDIGQTAQDAGQGALYGAALGEGLHLAGKVGSSIAGKVLPKGKSLTVDDAIASVHENKEPVQPSNTNPLTVDDAIQSLPQSPKASKGTGRQADIDAIRWGAEQLGVSPEELASVMALESGLNPNRWGGDKGKYFGLIQFGEGARKETGLDPKIHNTFEAQMPFVVDYFKKRGFKAENYHDPLERQTALYSTVLAGSPNRKYWGSSDSNGTSAAGVAKRMLSGDLRARANKFLGSSDTASTFKPLPEGAADYSIVPDRYVPKNIGGPDSRVELFPLAEQISEAYKVDPQVVKNIISADKKWNLKYPEEEITKVASDLRQILDYNGGNYEQAVVEMHPKQLIQGAVDKRINHILGKTQEEYAQRAAQWENDPYIQSGKLEDLFSNESRSALNDKPESFDYDKAISDLLKTPESPIDENIFNKAKKSNKSKAKVSNKIDETIKEVALSGQHDPLLDIYSQAKDANSLDMFVSRLDKLTQSEINDLGKSIGC